MKWHKVKPSSYKWLKWLYITWIIVQQSLIILYMFGERTIAISGMSVMAFIGITFIITVRPSINKSKKISRHLHNHIVENGLCKMEKEYKKKVYHFYPETYWRKDKSTNTLYIRFRLSGNKIDLRGLEQGLSDRLKKICLNVFEERGFIEYLFELEAEKQLVINSTEDIQRILDDTKITLSPSFIWNYRKNPHFMIAGTTGSGKTTFTRYLITSLINQGVRIVYIDIKKDNEMEMFCHSNTMITYAYEVESIAKEIEEIADQIQTRDEDIENMGIGEDFDYSFNPVCLICDEIILMKLMFPKKLYDSTIAHINSIIVGGRSKAIYCGLITQSALAEYFGNSGIRSNIGLRVALGQMTPSELSMIFGNEFADVKNLRHGQIGSGLIMRNGIDSRPREFIAPFISDGVLDKN